MEWFKGYIETSSSKIPLKSIKNSSNYKTYDEAKEFTNFAGIVKEDVVIVDFDRKDFAEKMLEIVEKEKLKCKVVQTLKKGYHFYFLNAKGSIQKNTTGNQTSCGFYEKIDYRIGYNGKTALAMLKLNGEYYKTIYDAGEYDEIPKWLCPIRKTNDSFWCMKDGDGRDPALYSYILNLQHEEFSNDEIKETLRIINTYIFEQPMDDKQLEKILRAESFQKPNFYDKNNKFLFYKFAEFLKNNDHVIKINNQLHIYDDGVYTNDMNIIKNTMIKHIKTLNKNQKNETLDYLNDLITKKHNKILNPNYITFKNGIYNIAANTFMEFTPDIITTNKINHNYNPNTYSEVCDIMLNNITCGDEEIRMIIEEMIGYTFYRSNRYSRAFVLIGDGSNGKSTLLDMIKNLLGEDNISSVPLKNLDKNFLNADIYGKLANLGDDIGDEFIPDTADFKKFVTGERVQVQRKGKDPFEFNSYAKLIFSANDLPRMKDRGNAIRRRLKIIRFNAVFSKENGNLIPNIKEVINNEETMEYLINLGIAGLKRLIENKDFTISEKVEAEGDEYYKINNPIEEYWEETECTSEQLENKSTEDTYKQYNEYCLRSGLTPISKIEFVRRVNKKFDLKTKVNKVNGKSYRIFIKTD